MLSLSLKERLAHRTSEQEERRQKNRQRHLERLENRKQQLLEA
jgi:hypothetical protein